jgi:hypothetical protein
LACEALVGKLLQSDVQRRDQVLASSALLLRQFTHDPTGGVDLELTLPGKTPQLPIKLPLQAILPDAKAGLSEKRVRIRRHIVFVRRGDISQDVRSYAAERVDTLLINFDQNSRNVRRIELKAIDCFLVQIVSQR